ncbi:transglutaminase family protein [Microbacterium sp. NPDC091313]
MSTSRVSAPAAGAGSAALRFLASSRRPALDLAAVAALLLVGIVGFGPTFGTPAYLPAAVGGLVLGLAIAAVAAWRRWGVLVIAGLVIGVYFVFGTPLALPARGILAVIPTLDSLRALAVGVVTSWKELLTTVAPVGVDDSHLIVPFLLTLVAATITASLALRVHPPAWALLPAAAYLGTQIALGTADPAAPLVQGIVFALAAAIWLAVRQAWQPQPAVIPVGEGGEPEGMLARRLVAGAVVLVVATVAGVATTAAVGAGPRYVLRDVVIPPFDVRQYPSPLQSFRGYVRDYPDDALFTAEGLPEGARIRLATMDAYNGTVYNVAEDGAGSSSAFSPVRSAMSPDAQGEEASVHITIAGLQGVWLPDAGAVRSIRFQGPRADELRRAAYYNDSTGTAVVTATLSAGDEYTLDSVLPVQPSDERLADEKFAPLKMPKQEGVPVDFAEIASDIVADANTPIEQVRALEQTLKQDGFFSHGLEGQVLSRAGHGAERIQTLLGGDQWVGDDEQYAVAMALLAGQLGIPARVVMGFYPDEDAPDSGTFTATGDTLHAWVEVAFEKSGWVAFDPTPPEDQVPTDQTTKPKADPKPQVLQPPPPEQEPVDLPPTVPDERGQEDEENPLPAILGIILLALGATAAVVAVVLAPFLVIGALKDARRRRRRQAERPADRISGGWDELVDRASDYGAPLRRGGTRAEDAGVLAPAIEAPQVATLARRADAEVFGPTDPTAEDVDAFWGEVDEIVGGMRQRAGFWGRLRARLDIRTLLAGTRFALPDRRIGRSPRREIAGESAPAPDAAAPRPAGGWAARVRAAAARLRRRTPEDDA